MTFDKILDDKRLWAVRYDGEMSNCFDLLFSSWYDMNWLRSFFQENLANGVYDLDGFNDYIDNEHGNRIPGGASVSHTIPLA